MTSLSHVHQVIVLTLYFQELQRRCNTLITLIERENAELEEREGKKKTLGGGKKPNSSGTSTPTQVREPWQRAPWLRAYGHPGYGPTGTLSTGLGAPAEKKWAQAH